MVIGVDLSMTFWSRRVRKLYSAEGGYLRYLAMKAADSESVIWRLGKGRQADSDR